MKKVVTWVVATILGVSVLSFLFGDSRTQDGPTIQSVTTPEQKPESITREQYEIYNHIYLELNGLQEKYEQTYEELGYVSLYEDIEDEEFPRFGSITREITSIKDKIPKKYTSMSPEEMELSMQTSTYAGTLIFLSVTEEGIDGLEAANEEKARLESILNEIEEKHSFKN